MVSGFLEADLVLGGLVVDVFTCLGAQGGAETFQVTSGPFGSGVTADQFPEVPTVMWDTQVRQFVDQDIVHHPRGQADEAAGDPDRARFGGTRSPTRGLVVDPAHTVGQRSAVQIAMSQLQGAFVKFLVTRVATPLPGLQSSQHATHPTLFLCVGERGGHEDDRCVPVPVGRHGTSATRTASYLDFCVRGHKVYGSPAKRSRTDVSCPDLPNKPHHDSYRKETEGPVRGTLGFFSTSFSLPPGRSPGGQQSSGRGGFFLSSSVRRS